jgi:exopolysaccharide production protein ExoQ
MPPTIAVGVFVVGVWVMFVLDRDTTAQPSRALWIPVIWLSIAGSRDVSEWFGLGSRVLSFEQAADGNPFDRNILAGLTTAGVIVLLTRAREVGRVLRANQAIIVFFSYGALSIVWSDFPDVAFKRWLKAVGDLVMVLVVLTDPDRPAAIKRFFARIGFVLMPASVLLIKYFPSLGTSFHGMSGSKKRYGGVANGKMLGVACLASGIACVWRLIEAYRAPKDARKARPLVAQGGLLAMTLWLLWMADSMNADACFVLASVVIVATSIPGLARKRWVVHVAVVAVMAIAYVALFLGVGLEYIGKDPTLTNRTELWDDIERIDIDPLLGAGFESFWLGKRLEKLWSIYWWRPNEAHNGYLEVFLNLGWIGVAILAFILVRSYADIVGACIREPDMGRLRLAYFVSGIVYSLTEAGFRMRHPSWFCLLLVMVVVPSEHRARRSTRSYDRITQVELRRPVESARWWSALRGSRFCSTCRACRRLHSALEYLSAMIFERAHGRDDRTVPSGIDDRPGGISLSPSVLVQ